TETEVTPLLVEGRVGLAAVNGPESVVVSGDTDAIEDVHVWAQEQGRKTTRLRVSHAFHSHHMDGMLAEFTQAATTVTFQAPTIPIVSTLTGEPVTADELCTPAYWVQQVRGTVRF